MSEAISSEYLRHFLIALLPLIVSGVLHMWVVKKGLINSLNIPISTKLFGANKTWRGVFIMTVVNGLLVYCVDTFFSLKLDTPMLIGALLGMAYIVFELPNSYMKRRLGIRPGERSQTFPVVFTMIDKLDSAIGVILVYYLVGLVELSKAGILLLVASIAHIVFSQLLVMAGIKKDF